MPTNIEIVARNYELFGSGDVEGLIDSYADDGVLVHHGPGAAPTRGVYTKGELGDYLTTMGQTVEIERFDIRNLLANGDTVVALIDIAFTARATGKRHEGSSVHVTTLRNGKNARHEIFTSEAESLYQL